MNKDQEYDLKSVNLPRLAGGSLKLITSLVESSATRWILLGNLLGNAGVTKLRKLNVEDGTTYQPVPPVNTLEGAAPIGNLMQAIQPRNREHKKGFAFNTVLDYRRAYQEGLTNPEEVAERVLKAIIDSDARQPALRAFIAWNRADLMEQANASTKRWNNGNPLGPLDGVPVPVKDEVDQVPYGTSVGTRFLGHTSARDDSGVVARLRAAGALLVGKTNMHEIGIGVTGLNTHHGTVRNPYDTSHHTGGSSSGSGAAVASGFGPLAVGADGGGSIRIPSSFCGVVGLKPTFGRVSEFGAAPLTWSMAHLGPIAATALDAAIGYSMMAGPDPNDPHTYNQPPVTLDGIDDLDLSDLTLGVYWPWFRHATPDIVKACEQILQDFQKLGAKVQEVIIPELDLARICHVVTISSEIATAMDSYDSEHRKDFALETRLDLALARTFTSRDYIKAQRVRTRLIAHFEGALKEVNAIVTPSTAVTAPSIRPDALPDGESDLSLLTEIMRFALVSNLTGHPAISFPAGYDGQGLPIGFQAIGRYWEENVLLRLANAAESFIERRMPKVYYNLLSTEAI